VVTRGELAAAELRVRLGALLGGLAAAVDRRAEQTAAITQQHARSVLRDTEIVTLNGRAYGPGARLGTHDLELLEHMRRQGAEIDVELPGDILRGRGLSDLDVEILLLAAAPSIHPTFATLFAFVNDTVSCTAATPHLAVEVLATGSEHERLVVEACGPFGALRSDGWLQTGDAARAPSLTPLLPADGVAELLRGSAVDSALLARRPAPRNARRLPAGVDAELVTSLAAAFGAGRLDVIGIWGSDRAGARAITGALLAARAAVHSDAEDASAALQRAAISGCACVIDVPADHEAAAAVAATVAASAVPVLLRGEEPLRAPELIADRRFAEIQIPASGFADRRATWAAAFPQLDDRGVDDLAARFRLLPDEVEAVASFDRTAAAWSENGHRPTLDRIAGLVSRRRSASVATVRTPQRTRDMLVLPEAELAQVLEVADAARAWPRIAEDWRLERFGNPGVTALFAGDPGTGKTLAAEVIASEVGIDLMVVDVSRLVSKWIGETEKHLDAVFTEAEASSCVLFFDEADALFGQRGEVSNGADRYANLEVGYLLQRLERYEGLVILASNLRANLDPAFTRRFHHVVHFPRPTEAERLRLWELALAEPVALAEPIDIARLAGLDLTGAGIAAIVRDAALAAHAHGRSALTSADILAAAGRQYRREARLLPRELAG
jgi:AAA+ superfamily predicted ATPase